MGLARGTASSHCAPIMKTVIQLYNNIKQKVKFLYQRMKLDTQENIKGRKLAIPIPETIALGIFKQENNIATKKSLFNIFHPPCSYKTLVVNLNRFARLALYMLALLLKCNRSNSHLVKYTDSTDIPVCLNKNARNHKTMAGLAAWGHSGKGWFFGLKLHLTCDFARKVLAVKFTSGNIHDKQIFLKLNKGLLGIFVADAAYLSQKLQQDFFIEHKRILFAKPRKNMKKLITGFQNFLYGTRMSIELNFRSLKLFYGLVTSLPHSVHGYLANYTYSLLAYLIA